MLLTPSVLQKGASGLCTETTEETVDETADSPLDEEFSDAGESDDGLEDADFAIKPFLFPAVCMCPFVAKGLCKHAGFNKQRALSTHCRMKHQDENGNPIIFTTVEEDPLEDDTAKIPCRWKCDRCFMPQTTIRRKQQLIARSRRQMPTQGLVLGQKSQEQNAYTLP
jgi:hypothetical protein